MWLGRSDTADVYLSSALLALRSGGELSRHELVEGGWQERLQTLVSALPRRPRGVRIWLGGARCRLVQAEPIEGLRSIEEAEAALSASLGVQGGAVDARLATWPPAGASWVVGCTPAGLVQEWEEVARSVGWRLHCLRPWWTATGMRTQPGTGMAMADDESVTYWRCDERGELCAAGTLLLPLAAQVVALQRLRVGGAMRCWRLDLNTIAHAGGYSAREEKEGDDEIVGTAA